MADVETGDAALAEQAARRRKQLCCVYWCREPAAVVVRVSGREHVACHKHAAFIKAEKLDWFDR
jgi:hypothetical protein